MERRGQVPTVPVTMGQTLGQQSLEVGMVLAAMEVVLAMLLVATALQAVDCTAQGETTVLLARGVWVGDVQRSGMGLCRLVTRSREVTYDV